MKQVQAVSHSPTVHNILSAMVQLPRKILVLHDQKFLAEYVVATICSKNCCDFTRAAFVVNNPDFNCCQGLVGYVQNEIMREQDSFESYVQAFEQSPFNQRVRAMVMPAFADFAAEHMQGRVAAEFGFAQSCGCLVPLKYGNTGLFLYECDSRVEQEVLGLVPELVAFIGFCPLA